MMINLNRTNSSLTGTCNGVPFSVNYSDEKYEKMKELERQALEASSMDQLKNIVAEFMPLTVESYKETVEHLTPYLHVNKATNTYHLHLNGVTSAHALPGALVTRIIHCVEKGIEIEPLVKAFARFMRSHLFSKDKAVRFANYLNLTYVNEELQAKLELQGMSPAVAKERATMYQTPITREGLLCTYKVSAESLDKFVKNDDTDEGLVKSVPRYDYEVDELSGLITYKKPEHMEDRVFYPVVMGTGGDSFFCGDKEGHIIRVGQVHYLDSWDKVNCNDNASCVPGLHVGNINYIKCYQRQNTVTHNVFVDPMDIGAFTDDGTGAIRTRRYFVHSSFEGVTRNIYHSSTFASLTDAEYKKLVEEAIANSLEESRKAAEARESKVKELEMTISL